MLYLFHEPNEKPTKKSINERILNEKAAETMFRN